MTNKSTLAEHNRRLQLAITLLAMSQIQALAEIEAKEPKAPKIPKTTKPGMPMQEVLPS